MGNMFGGKTRKRAEARAQRQEEQSRRMTQSANEESARARQAAERGAGGRGRNMLVGRLSSVLPNTLGGGS